MSTAVIERRNNALYVTGTRVSLASVIYQHRQGASPETILDCFPALASLANVNSAIAFALANPEIVEEYLAQQEQKWDAIAAASDPPPPEFLRKLRAKLNH